MKKKVVISIVMLAVLIAAIVTVVCINQKSGHYDKLQSFSTAEEMNEASDFTIEYSDRLCGVPVTGYEASKSTVVIHYGDAGFVRKTFDSAKTAQKADNSEQTQQEINGKTVGLKQKDGKVFAAEWTDNNFLYTISVNEGIDTEEMTEYIEATR